MDDIYLLYAVLSGLSLYMAILAMFRRRLPYRAMNMAFANLLLAVAFAILALGRANVLGFRHGQNTGVMRVVFSLYGITLLLSILRTWLDIWRRRQERGQR